MLNRRRAYSGPHYRMGATLCVALMTPFAPWVGSAEAQVSVQPLVISGDPAPGTQEGVVFSSFRGFSTWKESDGPMMNPHGRAAFIASPSPFPPRIGKMAADFA